MCVHVGQRSKLRENAGKWGCYTSRVRRPPLPEASARSTSLLLCAALFACPAAVGCSGPSATSGTVRAPATGAALAGPEYVPEFSWFVRPLPTDGTVQLALYLDAGSRDATPPQVATLAAHALAARLTAETPSAPVRARVTPDATAFETACPAAQVLPCVERLTSLLRPAPLSAQELTGAHVQLREARASATGDATRSAEAAALRALLGADADALFPLGQAEHDTDASSALVQAFVDDHYGSQRALLLAEGDLDAHALDDLGRELRDQRPAPRQRASRALTTGTGVAVDVAHEGAAAVALRARSMEHARAIVQRLRDPAFHTTAERAPLDLAAFELRGGALVLLTLPSARLEGRPEEAAQRLATLALRASDATDTLPWRDPATGDASGDATSMEAARAWRSAASLQALGERWASRQPSARDDTSFSDAPLGLGITLDGGRADALDEADPDARTRRSAETALREALAAAQRQARPWQQQADLEAAFALPDADADTEVLWAPVQATLPNGARLRVAGSPTGENGVLVAFDGGPGEDGEPVHGRAALAVTALARRCARMLGALDGVHVATHVQADRVGLWFEDRGAGGERVLDVAARCGLELSPDDADLEDAKRVLLTELGPVGSEARMRGWVAAALSPSQPGRVAPAGVAERLDAVRLGDVARALERLRVGARSHVVAFVRESPRRIARRIAPRLASALVGEAFVAERSRGLGNSPHAVAWVGGAPSHARLLVAFRDPLGGEALDTPESHRGRAHAAAVAARLRSVGLAVVWAAGDGGAYGHWSAVAIETTVDTLDGLPARIEAALREDLPLATPLAELARARPQSLGDQALAALPPLATGESTPTTGPRYIVARPQGAEAMRRQNGR